MKIGGQRLWQFNGSFSDYVCHVREETTIRDDRNAAAAANIDYYSGAFIGVKLPLLIFAVIISHNSPVR